MNSRPPSTPGPRAVVAAHRPFCAQSRNIVSCLLIASLFISSCSMFNPYVEPETGQCPANADGTALSEAVQCASSWQNEYRGALQEHARFSSTIGTTLIIASAVALGIGATSGSSEAIIWIGAGGAAGYGVASWLSSKPREAAYLAGMKAMSCAISITQPLVALNATVTNLEGQLITLNTALGSAKPAYRRAEAALLAYQRVDFEPARLAIAQQAVESAANQIAATDQLYEEATSMRARYDAAPSQLLGAVERITVEVDALLAQTTADIQALPSIINGLADASGMFTSLAVTPPEPEVTEKLIKDGEVVVQADEPELRELIDAISELRGELDALATLARPIRVQVDNASSKVSLAALKDCGVDDDTLAGDQ